VHTREQNLPHVEQLLHTSAPMYAARQLSSNVIKTVTTNPLVMIGSAALAGLVLYSLLPRNRRPTVYSLRELPSRLRDTARAVQETVNDLTGTDTVSSLTGTGQGQSQQPQGQESQNDAKGSG
jgi:hypothetical protein